LPFGRVVNGWSMRVREQSENVNRFLSRLERLIKDAQYSVFAVKSIDKIG
jgi:flagellar biosynthesis chaperone FliJ